MENPNDLQKIVLNLDTEAIDIETMGKALLAIDKEYRHFVRIFYGNKKEYAAERLKISKVREGSHVYEFLSALALSTPFLFASSYNTLSDFFNHMRSVISYLTLKNRTKIDLDQETLANMIAIAAMNQTPTTQINLTVQGNVNIHDSNIQINHGDANTMSINAKRELDILLTPDTQSQGSQTIIFETLNNAAKSLAGNRAIIPAISPSIRDAIFASEDVKNQVLKLKNDNPFSHGFIAEIEVIQVVNRPDSYRITRVMGQLNDGHPEE